MLCRSAGLELYSSSGTRFHWDFNPVVFLCSSSPSVGIGQSQTDERPADGKEEKEDSIHLHHT